MSGTPEQGWWCRAGEHDGLAGVATSLRHAACLTSMAIDTTYPTPVNGCQATGCTGALSLVSTQPGRASCVAVDVLLVDWPALVLAAQANASILEPDDEDFLLGLHTDRMPAVGGGPGSESISDETLDRLEEGFSAALRNLPAAPRRITTFHQLRSYLLFFCELVRRSKKEQAGVLAFCV